MEFSELLQKQVDEGASDLFLSAGAPAQLKVDGNMFAINNEILTSEAVYRFSYSVLNEAQIMEFETNSELNLALHSEGIGRFRINIFRQMGQVALVARHINAIIPSIESLGLPVILKDLILEPRGLVLMVGGTGTGKSTSLASMIDHRNNTRTGHILSIEDPVEFVHVHKKSLINQREVGIDTKSYALALKNAMREAPDLIMIGEIRDMETMKSALAYAETGHLCVSTLHANNANQAIDRIINFFPENAHKQLRKDLALNLRAIVSQRLPKSTDGRRVAAVEVMLNTPYISELIERGEIAEIKKAMIKSNILGCQTFDDALFNLVQAGKIDAEEALQHADSRNDLSLRFRLERGSRPKQIKKNVAYAKHVDFNDYRTFMIRRLSVADEFSDLIPLVEEGMRHTLVAKGLEESPQRPDIELQYVFTSRTIEPEKMGDVDNAISAGINVEPEVRKHGTLKVNIVDLDSRKPVWQVVASREIVLDQGAQNDAEQLRSQNEVNKDLEYLFDEFPPKALEIAE